MIFKRDRRRIISSAWLAPPPADTHELWHRIILISADIEAECARTRRYTLVVGFGASIIGLGLVMHLWGQ